jgi:hypothetical protein
MVAVVIEVVVGIELPSLGFATTWPFFFFYQKGCLRGFAFCVADFGV